MNLNPELLERYTEAHTEPEPSYLQELVRRTNSEIPHPYMMSGHLQGRVLKMISQLLRPRRVLEIGTFTGYSALCFAEGLANDGKIITLDVNEDLKPVVDEFIEKSGFRGKIDNRIGKALDIIPQLDEVFDLVFIDADKTNYLNYYNLVFDKVRSGGYIIADNVLWSGKVLGDPSTADPATQSMMNYNRIVHEDPRVEELLLPIRDGLMIARKK